MTSERKPYPSFAPEDFPAVYKASQTALQNAQLKAIQRNDQQVSSTTEPVVEDVHLTSCSSLCYSNSNRVSASSEGLGVWAFIDDNNGVLL